jgi:hypothetical protein
MTYLPSHPFRPHPRDSAGCGAPDSGDVCAQPEDNPVHRFTTPEVERLAAALVAFPWETITPAHWGRRGTPCKHNRPGTCGVCSGDAHIIAAAVLAIQSQSA